MKKEELIKFCRYYKGEKDCSTASREIDALKAIERLWVEKSASFTDFIALCLDEYLHAGLRTFEQTDDTPATLKAVLFNRFCKERIDIEGFKAWYKEFYSK